MLKLVYLLNAREDFEKDHKKGAFNAIAAVIVPNVVIAVEKPAADAATAHPEPLMHLNYE